jgi:hypothetical protein
MSHTPNTAHDVKQQMHTLMRQLGAFRATRQIVGEVETEAWSLTSTDGPVVFTIAYPLKPDIELLPGDVVEHSGGRYMVREVQIATESMPAIARIAAGRTDTGTWVRADSCTFKYRAGQQHVTVLRGK